MPPPLRDWASSDHAPGLPLWWHIVTLEVAFVRLDAASLTSDATESALGRDSPNGGGVSPPVYIPVHGGVRGLCEMREVSDGCGDEGCESPAALQPPAALQAPPPPLLLLLLLTPGGRT